MPLDAADGLEQKLDLGQAQRQLPPLAEPGLGSPLGGLVSGQDPLPASGDREMAELGQNHGEVAGIGEPAGTARAPVGPVQTGGTVAVVVAELDEWHRQFLCRLGGTAVVPVDDTQSTLAGEPDVVGPEVAMAQLRPAR